MEILNAKGGKCMKKLLLIFLVLMILIPNGAMAIAQSNDIEGSWAKNEINYLYEKEIVSGYPDGSFRPNNFISKAEFYRIIN